MYFSTQDVIISFVLASVLALVGILAAYVAVLWARLDASDMITDANIAGMARARNVLAGTAVSANPPTPFMYLLSEQNL